MGKESEKVMAMARRRGFLWPSYSIHGGVAGFYDYGPLGTAMKRNIENAWLHIFVAEEGFLEVDTPNVTPYPVFKASGHVEEFTDLMAKCGNCRSFFKVESIVADGAQVNEASLAGLKCPDCGEADWTAGDLNLMFRTEIGPEGGRRAFLRPETAQGIFVNFNAFYRLARERMPFGVAQLGRGFRNEISPRQGPLRLREFNMAEAEFFVDPEDTEFPRFDNVSGIDMNLLPAEREQVRMTIGKAFDDGIVRSKHLAYFMARTGRFLEDVGVDPARLRFRQHERDEMAHYAEDCWDAEIELSYGWTEVVGIADRSAYDLTSHMEFTGEDMTASRRLDEPVETTVTRVVPDRKEIGIRFRGDAPSVIKALEAVKASEAEGTLRLEEDGQEFEVPQECYKVETVNETITVERYIPRVIEPSFGIDRIFYSVLEHGYREEERDGEDFRVLGLPASTAPIKFGVFPLVSREPLEGIASGIENSLRALRIPVYYDAGGSIGRRYARMDEIGTPFCITVDFDTVDDKAVTIRSRDSREQARAPMEGIAEHCLKLIKGEQTGTDGA